MQVPSVTIFVSILLVVMPIKGYRINSKIFDRNIVNEQLKLSNVKLIGNNYNIEQRNDNSIAYVKASIPIRIFQCMQRLNILKCMKIFILQRMERSPVYTNSGNLTADFLDQVLSSDKGNGDIFDRFYIEMSEEEINNRLLHCFQRFFKDREIKLHFIPGMVVKVAPSEENSINLSVKRATSTTKDYGRRRTKPHEYLIQFGVPAMVMPAILMGTVLPFVLPAIKMATLMSGLINHGALIAALMYAAKSAAGVNGAENKVYFNSGYHRDMRYY